MNKLECLIEQIEPDKESRFHLSGSNLH